MTQETFAPVLPIMRVRDAEQAVRLTNDSPFGLSGSVWSRHAANAREIARRIEAGSVCVNDVLSNYMVVNAPLGGIKSSGIGVRHGVEGLRQFCRVQTVIEDVPLLSAVSKLVARLAGFPYRRRMLNLVRLLMRLRY